MLRNLKIKELQIFCVLLYDKEGNEVENSKKKELQIIGVLFYDEERVEVEDNSFLQYFMIRKELR